MKKFKNNRGFSLVELLMVMAIIAILASIVLNSISNSRARAEDSQIKQQLNSFRTAAEIYFINQTPNGYSPAVSDCTDAAGIFKNTDAVNGQPGIYIAPENLPSFSSLTCDSSDSAYAVKATLYSGNEYWCVDNTGASRSILGMPTSGTVCPP